MKLIKILIAFICITLMMSTVTAYEIYEQNDDQTSVWLTTQMPTGLDDLRAGYFHNGDFPKGAISQPDDDFGYLHSGAKSAGHGNMKKAYD